MTCACLYMYVHTKWNKCYYTLFVYFILYFAVLVLPFYFYRNLLLFTLF